MMSITEDYRRHDHVSSSIRILLLNPNSSSDMTKGMMAATEPVLHRQLEVSSYTAPSSAPASINDDKDIEASTRAVLADDLGGISQRGSVTKTEGALDYPDLALEYDAIIVACFSVHTLVPILSEHPLYVTGIFEASVVSALSMISRLPGRPKWGIVTTGKFWEEHLTRGVDDYLGAAEGGNAKFAGVFSTGLNAGDFHSVDPEEVRRRLREATRRLLETGDVRCVVMGCGGMAGLEEAIREEARDVYGKERKVWVVDGVQAAVLQADLAVKSRRAFG